MMEIRTARPEDSLGMAEVHSMWLAVGYAGIVSETILASQDVGRRNEGWLGVLKDNVPYPTAGC
jgi:hypothetical protein